MLALLLTLPALAADNATLRAGLEDPAGWQEVDRKVVKDVGEVVVRFKSVAGENCLEGSTTAPADPDQLLRAAADIDNQPSWSSWDVPISARLGSDPERFDYYQVLDNPAPVADRYWFLRGSIRRSGDARIFAWEQVEPSTHPDALATVTSKFPGAIPTRVNVGDWTFTPQGSTTAIRYRICTDAGGSLPKWVGEYAARTTLPTNVADIVRRVLRK